MILRHLVNQATSDCVTYYSMTYIPYISRLKWAQLQIMAPLYPLLECFPTVLSVNKAHILYIYCDKHGNVVIKRARAMLKGILQLIFLSRMI